MNNDCIFCKIINGDIPSHNVYEDDDFVAFLDIEPRAPGHVQLIPKEHHRWVWDVPSEKIGVYMQIAQKIAKAQQQAFDVEMVRSQIFGDEVPHAHLWLWPNIERDGSEKDFKNNAEKIRNFL